MTADSSKRRWLLGAGCAAVVGAGALAYALLSPSTGKGADGAALLSVSLPDLDGHAQALDQWRGKVLVVNFWATWCAPCREEMPRFIRAQIQDGPRGLQFVGIAIDEAPKVKTFASEIGVNYPTLLGGYGALELSKTFGNDLMALPFTIILHRDGQVAHTQLGPLNEKRLDAIVSQLLEKKT